MGARAELMPPIPGAFIEEAERVMFGVLATSLEASSEFDTDRNCLGAGTGLAANLGFGGMFTGFVIRISWAMELGRNGWGETKARFWIPLKLLARSLTLMITSLLGSFSFSHSESFSFSSSTGSGGWIGTAELLLLLRAQKLLSSLSSSFGSVPLAIFPVGLRKKCLGAGTGFGEIPGFLNSTASS